MTEIDSLHYIRFLSDFWRKFYKNESIVIEGALSATAEIIKGFYFAFLQRQLPTAISDFPVFQEKFWNIIVFNDKSRVGVDINLKVTQDLTKIKFVRYLLDEPYIDIPFLYNIIYDPTIILKQGSYKDNIEILKPDTDNTLVINQDYINEYNGNIVSNNKVIKPKGVFTATSGKFTLADSSLTGLVRRNNDYFIKTFNSGTPGEAITLSLDSYIYFRKEKDVFLNDGIAQRLLPNESAIEISLYAPKSLQDYQELYKFYGSIIGVAAQSSVDYQQFISGIITLYQDGPMVTPLNIALNVANGYPISRLNENIIKIEIQEKYFLLTSDRSNAYKVKRVVIEDVLVNPDTSKLERTKRAYPRLQISNPYYYLKKLNIQLYEKNISNIPDVSNILDGSNYIINPVTNQISPYRDFSDINLFTIGLTYDIFWPIDESEGFVDQLKVVDYKTQDKWWLEKIASGKVLDSIVKISSEARADTNVVDYLFDKYIKYNTFGVFIDSRITANFQGITDFIRIINQVKPSGKTFLVNEQDLNIYSEIESADVSDVSIRQSMPLETNYRIIPKIGMNMLGIIPGDPYSLEQPIRMGQRLEDIGSAYDYIDWKIQFVSSIINGQPSANSIVSYFELGEQRDLVVGSLGLFLGKSPDGCIFDSVNLFTIEIRPQTASLDYTYASINGNQINDTSGNNNTGYIIPSAGNASTIMSYAYSSIPPIDISQYNNNAQIIQSIVNRGALAVYNYIQILGGVVTDSSGANNQAAIISSIVNRGALAVYNYSSIINGVINDLSGNSNAASIIPNSSNYPRADRIVANYLLHGNTQDSTINAYNASVSGSVINPTFLSFGDNNIDALSVPNQVINGLSEYSISFWVRINGFHSANANSSNFLFTVANSVTGQDLGLGYIYQKGFSVIYKGAQNNFVTNDIVEDNQFHLITLTKDLTGCIKVYSDKSLSFIGEFDSSSVVCDVSGFIFNQIQATPSTGYDANQCGYFDISKLVIYNTELSSNEISKIYNIGL